MDRTDLRGLLALLAMAGAAVDCSSATSSECAPVGATVSCACPGGGNGTRLCHAGGVLGTCICSGADAGPDGTINLDVPLLDDRGQSIDVAAVGDAVTSVDVADVLPAGPLGAPCTQNDQCSSMLCLAIERCTESCTTTANCVPGWTCGTPAGESGLECECAPSMEVCDGLDNNCDGVIDNGATCGAGMTCAAGACACVTGSLCSGACVNLPTDNANCGACGTACGTGTTCSSGECACSGAMLTACASGCTNLGTDNNNCGRCGTVCTSGTTCSSGSCLPVGGVCPPACVTDADCSICWSAGESHGSNNYCCSVGLCIFRSGACGTTDAGTMTDAGGSTDASTSDVMMSSG